MMAEAPWWADLEERQRRFVMAYNANGGNGLRAATEAGYAFPGVEAHRLLKNANVIAAFEKLRLSQTKIEIATREERQAFWSTTMRNEAAEWNARLRASELLGKSQADFIDRKEITGANGGPLQHEIKADFSKLSLDELQTLDEITAKLDAAEKV
jgi:phage terminase small subunit